MTRAPSTATVALALTLLASGTAGAATGWDEALRTRGLDPAVIHDPLAFTEEMRMAAVEAAGRTSPVEQLDRLQEYLFAGGRTEASFVYDPEGTFTAAEAFRLRRGNCVAFTSLFIAMARSMGIDVRAALVASGGTPEREGDLVLIKNHIVAAYAHDDALSVYDFYLTRTGPPVGVRVIDDLWMAAIYLNNLGVASLRTGDLSAAESDFDAALRLAPDFGAVWSNLGVTRRRMGDHQGAIDAYLLGLQLDRRNPSIRMNLRTLFGYLAAGSSDALEQTEGYAYRQIVKGDAALHVGQVHRAYRYYRKARRRLPDDPIPTVAMARCKLLLGKVGAARELLEEAAALGPSIADASRLLESLDRVAPLVGGKPAKPRVAAEWHLAQPNAAEGGL